ncbi:MAG: hypothetical protein AAF497_12960 [Planctomycetota bacterium]
MIRVNPTGDADFILRAMKANGTTIPLAPPLKCDTFHNFLSSVWDKFKIVTTGDDPALLHPSAAGIILKVDKDSITIRAMSTQGFWEAEPHKIKLRHITYVVFGGKYEEMLEQIAKLPDT